MAEEKRLIGEMLMEEGLINESQLQEALAASKKHGGKVVENLIALKHLVPHDFVVFLANQPGVASIDLLNYTIPKDVIELIPAEFALKHEILPIDKMGRDLTVGMACPLDSRTVQELEGMTGMHIRPLLASLGDTRAALNRYYAPKEKMTYSAGERPVPTRVSNFVEDAPRSDSGEPAPPGVAPLTLEPLSGEAEAQDEELPVPDGVPEEEGTEAILPKVESALTFEGIAHLVREISTLPALPETVVHVREAMDNPDTTTRDVAEMLNRDPALAAKVISLANSPAYGFRQRVDDVNLATSLLGLREVFSVVLSAAVIDYFDESRRFDYKKFWKRSLLCATAAKVIAKTCGHESAQGIFTAGLLHDLGRPALAEVVPERYGEIDQTLPETELIILENNLFGMGHPEVGFVLAEQWGLPVEITEPIRFHHNVSQATEVPKLVAMVSLASILTDAYGQVTKDNIKDLVRECKEAMDYLELNDKQFIAILGATAKAIKTSLGPDGA